MNSQEELRSKSLGEWVKANALFHNIWTHDVAERLRIRRKSLASDAGLDDSFDVGTYPQSHESDREVLVNPNGGLIKGALLATALLTTGGGLAVTAMSLLSKTGAVETVIENTETIKDWKLGPIEVTPPGE